MASKGQRSEAAHGRADSRCDLAWYHHHDEPSARSSGARVVGLLYIYM